MRSSRRAMGLGLALFLVAAPAVGQAQDAVRAGSLVFRDVAYDDPKLGSLKAGSVELRGVVREGETFSADSATVTDLVLADPFTTTTIPSLTIDRPRGGRGLLDALGGSGGAADWIAFLSTAGAERMTAETLVRRATMKGVTTESTARGVRAQGLDAGSFARLTIDSQEGSTQSPNPLESGTFKVGVTLYEDVNIAESLRFETGGGEGPAKLLLGRGVVESMSFEEGAGKFRMDLGRVEMRGVFGRALKDPLGKADLVAIELGERPGSDFMRKLAPIFEELAETFRIDEATVESVAFKLPDGSVTMGALRAKQYSLRNAELLEVRDMEVETPDGMVSFGRLAFENLDYRRTSDALVAILAAGGQPDLSSRAVAGLIPTGVVRMEDFSVSAATGDVSIGSLAVATAGSGGMPDAVTATLTGAVLDISALPPTEGTDKLIELGYPEIVMDGRFALRYDKAARTLTLERSGVAFGEAGSIEATLRLAGVDADALLDAGPGAPARAMQAPFSSLSIEIADLGFAQRFYASVAKTAGVSPEAIRDGLAAEMRNQAAQMFGPALVPGAADAVAQFLKNSGKLTIEVQPRSDRPPLTIGDMQTLAPPQLADRVSVVMRATAP